jgi:hypothetical protein
MNGSLFLLTLYPETKFAHRRYWQHFFQTQHLDKTRDLWCDISNHGRLHKLLWALDLVVFFNAYHKVLYNIVTTTVWQTLSAQPVCLPRVVNTSIASVLVRLSWGGAALEAGRGSNIRGPERVQSSGHVVPKMCCRK